MKKFTLLTTVVNNYMTDYDENTTSDVFMLLVPSRNNKHKEEIADFLITYLGDKFKDIKEFGFEEALSETAVKKTSVPVFNHSGYTVGREIKTIRRLAFSYGDENFFEALVNSQEIDYVSYKESDGKDMRLFVPKGVSYHDSYSRDLLKSLEKETGFIVKKTVFGLACSIFPSYDERDSTSFIPEQIIKLSGSLKPLFKEIPRYFEDIGERLIDYEYGGRFEGSPSFEEAFGAIPAQSPLELEKYQQRYYIDSSDNGMGMQIQARSFPILGKKKGVSE